MTSLETHSLRGTFSSWHVFLVSKLTFSTVRLHWLFFPECHHVMTKGSFLTIASSESLPFIKNIILSSSNFIPHLILLRVDRAKVRFLTRLPHFSSNPYGLRETERIACTLSTLFILSLETRKRRMKKGAQRFVSFVSQKNEKSHPMEARVSDKEWKRGSRGVSTSCKTMWRRAE